MEAPASIESLASIERLSIIEGAVFRVLTRQYPKFSTMSQFIEEAYGNRSDGAPEYATGVVRKSLLQLRKKLSPYGWTVPKHPGGRAVSGSFRLEPIG